MSKTLIDYNNLPTTSLQAAVAKKTDETYFIKRSNYGFFYNEEKLKHKQALNMEDKNCYVFVRVPKDVYDMYISFLRTRNQGRANVAERMWNENRAEKQ